MAQPFLKVKKIKDLSQNILLGCIDDCRSGHFHVMLCYPEGTAEAYLQSPGAEGKLEII